jgi:hypothetical protein
LTGVLKRRNKNNAASKKEKCQRAGDFNGHTEILRKQAGAERIHLSDLSFKDILK